MLLKFNYKVILQERTLNTNKVKFLIKLRKYNLIIIIFQSYIKQDIKKIINYFFPWKSTVRHKICILEEASVYREDRIVGFKRYRGYFTKLFMLSKQKNWNLYLFKRVMYKKIIFPYVYYIRLLFKVAIR